MNRAAAILVLLATLAFVLSPLFSGGFGGFDPGQFPIPQDDPPVQPAGWAFSIWGVIYAWLLAHAAFGLFARADAADWAPCRWPLLASLAVGATWISVAQASPIWATVLIWVMLGGAVWALLVAPRRDSLLAAAPLGLYAGWMTAASFVSLGLLGAGYGLVGETVAAALAILGALVAASVVLVRRSQPAYALAVVWALVAIAIAGWTSVTAVAVFALAGAAVVAALAALRRRRSP